ncbi:Hypothetical predicted protein [Octopus vulgaris]|uniref:Uncharacterized protein n=1 Tax=Octopus vulgaris TaxID=6645 RepID=A0AA36B6S2_OCTVU|nr:Hypothetical predicted protein [Octopus vulgaris]
MDMDNEFVNNVKTETEVNDEKSMTNLEGYNQDISVKSTVIGQPSTTMEINGNISTEACQLQDTLYTESNTTDTSYPNALSNVESNSLQSALNEAMDSQIYVPVVNNTFSELADGSNSDGVSFKPENIEEVKLMNTSSAKCDTESGEDIQDAILIDQKQSSVELSENIFPVVTDTHVLNSEESQEDITGNLTNLSEGDLNFRTGVEGVCGSYTETEVAPDYIQVSTQKVAEFSTEPNLSEGDLNFRTGIEGVCGSYTETEVAPDYIQVSTQKVAEFSTEPNLSEGDLNFRTGVEGVCGSYTETEVAPDYIHVSSQKVAEFSTEPTCEKVEELEENLKNISTSALSCFEEIGNVENVNSEIIEKPSVFSVGDADSSQEILEEKPEVVSFNQFTLKTETIGGDKILEERTTVEITEELDVQNATVNNMTVSEHIEIVEKGNVETDGNIVGTPKDNDSTVLFEQVDVQVEEFGISTSSKPMMTSIEQSENFKMNIPNETETSFPEKCLPSREDSGLLENMVAVAPLVENQTVVVQKEEMLLLENEDNNVVDMTVKGEKLIETIVNEPAEESSKEPMGSPKIATELSKVQEENKVKVTEFEAVENHVPTKKLTDIQSHDIKTFSMADKNTMETPTYIGAEVSSDENIDAFSAKPNQTTKLDSLEIETNVTTKDADRREKKPEHIVSSERKQIPVTMTENNRPRHIDILRSIRGKTKREAKMIMSQDAFNRASEILKIVQNKSNTYEDGIYVHPMHRAYATEIKDGNINLLKYTRLSDGQLSDDSNHYEYLKSFRSQNRNDYINMKINGRKRRKMVGRFIYECCNKITLLENIAINYIDGNKQNQNPSNLSIQIEYGGGEKHKKNTKKTK